MVSWERYDADGIVNSLKIELLTKKLDVKKHFTDYGTNNARVMMIFSRS